MAVKAIVIIREIIAETDFTFRCHLHIFGEGFSTDTGPDVINDVYFAPAATSSDVNVEILRFARVYLAEKGVVVGPTDSIRLINPYQEIPAADVVDSDLISHWMLDEASGQRNDSVGTNHLTDVSTVGSAAAPEGLAANFIAANSEHLTVPTNSSLDLGDIDFSFMLWIYPEILPGVAISHYANPGSEDLSLLVVSSSITLYVSNNGSAPWTTPQVIQTVSLNSWYGVFFWYDSVANTINVQVDDGPVASLAHASGVHAGSAPWVIGSQNGTDYWDGRIWNVRFAKRVWTAEERTALLGVLG